MEDITEELVRRIKKHHDAYYNGEPTISDSAYDALEDMLRSRCPDHKLLSKVGAKPPSDTKWEKKEHRFPMASLNKANSIEDVIDWENKSLPGYSGELAVTEKLDGISIALVYEDGVLVEALTRGDGTIGEDILRNVMMMNGAPLVLPQPIDAGIRGEIVLRKSIFNKYFSDYSNPRNAAAGIAKREDQKEAEACKHLDVYSYELHIGDSPKSEPDKYSQLRELGFQTPNLVSGCQIDRVDEVYENYIGSKRESLDYEIDGLVVRWMSTERYEAAGTKSGNPDGAVALKFKNQGAITTLRDVNWQVNATGRLTPVAIFDDVNVAGAELRRASLYNYGYIENLSLNVGDLILVVRANDVIPRVEEVIEKSENSTPIIMPEKCPECNSNVKLEGEYIICVGKECPAKSAGKIKRWVESLDLLDWGEFIIEKITEEGIVESIPDLYTLDADDIALITNNNGAKVGDKTARKLITRLRDNREISLDQLIGGLNIKGCRRKTVKTIVESGIDTVEELINSSPDKLTDVKGIGEKTANNIFYGLKRNRETINTLLDNNFVEIVFNDGNLEGLSFCMTGKMSKPRKHIKKDIESAGGDVKGMSKSVDYLVTNNKNSTSSKAKKARKYSIPIINESKLNEMMS